MDKVSKRQLLSLSLFGLLGGISGFGHALARTEQATGQFPRVVALDWGMAQTLLAIGVTPVAIADIPGYRNFVVEPTLPDTILDIGRGIEPNLELLAQIAPDLIVMTQQFASVMPFLEQIAPAISFPINSPERKPLEHAREATRRLARSLGVAAAGEIFLHETDTTFHNVKATVSSRRPLYIAQIEDERHVTLHARGGIFQDVLDVLGYINAWTGPTNDWGFVTVGIERLAENPEAAFVSVGRLPDNMPALLAENPIWNALPFVQRGRCFFLPPTLFYGAVPSASRFATLLSAALVSSRKKV